MARIPPIKDWKSPLVFPTEKVKRELEKKEPLYREEIDKMVCDKILGRALDIQVEVDDALRQNRLDDVEIGISQLWEVGNISSVFGCTKAYFEIREIQKKWQDLLYKERMERTERILKWKP